MNQDIAAIQQLLINHGFSVGKAGADGVWGADSQRGLVKALQTALAASASIDPDEDDAELIAELCADEGTVLHAYQDHLGYWTIGTGRLIDKRRGGGISKAENDMLLRNDIAKVKRNLDAAVPWWRKMDPVRRRVLTNMCFNLGIGNAAAGTGLLGFKNTLEAMRQGDYARAAAGMLVSKWATQVGERAQRLAKMMRDGK